MESKMRFIVATLRSRDVYGGLDLSVDLWTLDGYFLSFDVLHLTICCLNVLIWTLSKNV